jgi:cellulose synthase/poly-beta-1,6-N-acetylglucosamine synthase-like glycosyltransferase
VAVQRPGCDYSGPVTSLTILAAVAATILAIPALIFFVECFASLFLGEGEQITRPEGISVVIMIPAHDEEAGIRATLADVRSQLGPSDRMLVVADNCTDGTAAVARSDGAEVVERSDPERRGKGYALAHGIDYLATSPPDVVIVIDADCLLTEGTIDALVHRTVETQRPVQADYVMRPTERSPVSMISALAFIVRNRVRPRGLLRLGQPCQLDGTGMAFPWSVIHAAPNLGANIVEDLMLGIELASIGHEPLFCIEAGVRSGLPSSRGAALQQRRRWEHGHLGTLLRHGPRLIREGLACRRLGLIAMGADLIVPPLALLVALLASVLGLAGLLVLFGGPTFPAWIAGIAFGLVGLGVMLGWARYGRKAVPFRYLLVVPLYVLWKLPLYVPLLFGRRERRWRRTER